jgi:hypothetical protein
LLIFPSLFTSISQNRWSSQLTILCLLVLSVIPILSQDVGNSFSIPQRGRPANSPRTASGGSMRVAHLGLPVPFNNSLPYVIYHICHVPLANPHWCLF